MQIMRAQYSDGVMQVIINIWKPDITSSMADYDDTRKIAAENILKDILESERLNIRMLD